MPKIGFNTAISACGAEWTVALQLMREMHRQAGFPCVNVIPILISTLQSSNDESCLLFKVQVCVNRVLRDCWIFFHMKQSDFHKKIQARTKQLAVSYRSQPILWKHWGPKPYKTFRIICATSECFDSGGTEGCDHLQFCHRCLRRGQQLRQPGFGPIPSPP